MIKTSAERISKTEEPRKHQTAAFPGIITIAVLQLHSPAMPEAIRRISLHSHPAALSFSCPDITCFLLSDPDPEDMFPALFFLHFIPDYATLFLHWIQVSEIVPTAGWWFGWKGKQVQILCDLVAVIRKSPAIPLFPVRKGFSISEFLSRKPPEALRSAVKRKWEGAEGVNPWAVSLPGRYESLSQKTCLNFSTKGSRGIGHSTRRSSHLSLTMPFCSI